jgi:Immunity protein 35
MITREEARQLVVAHIGRPDWLPPEDDWILVDEATIEKPWGWVFFYTSKLWRETGDIRYAVAGNSPLIVERKGGRILQTGTAYPVEQYIANYERHGNPHG